MSFSTVAVMLMREANHACGNAASAFAQRANDRRDTLGPDRRDSVL